MPTGGLAGLDEMPLDHRRQQFLDAASHVNGGSASWKARKVVEAHGLLGLERLSNGTMTIEWIDLSAALRARIRLDAPVPVLRPGEPDIDVVRGATIALRYVQEAIEEPQPGASFVQIEAPLRVWLPQVPPFPVQPICLGVTLPAGIPCSELVLMTYTALTLQTYQLDPGDPGGVFNKDAADWWQARTDRIPLTDVRFLDDRTDGFVPRGAA